MGAAGCGASRSRAASGLAWTTRGRGGGMSLPVVSAAALCAGRGISRATSEAVIGPSGAVISGVEHASPLGMGAATCGRGRAFVAAAGGVRRLCVAVKAAARLG